MKKNDCSMPAKSDFFNKGIGKYLKYIIFSTNILAIFVLLTSILAWTVIPSKIPIIAYLGLGFPIILFINIVYLILWLVSWRWKYALVQFAVILCCWNPISTCFPIHFKTKDIPESSFKVLSYNVRSFNWLRGEKARKNPIFDYIKESNADIVCFQEFTVSTGKGKRDIITQSEMNEIMKDYPYRSIVNLGRKRKGHIYGIACYSKFPISDTHKLPIESSYNGSVMYTLDIQEKKVTLINNHLESNRLTSEDKKAYKDFLKTRDKASFEEMAHSLHNRLGAGYKIREKQAELIKQKLDEQKTDATIVCGDFNDAPISYTYHTIKGDNLIDSYVNTGFGQGITYHENYFFVRIDFILHSTNINSYNCTVDRVKYSDHYPIWTHLSFK